jgi:hypothetical protein
VAADLRGHLRPVGLGVALRESVEGHDRLDLVSAIRRDEKRQHAAHAEADDADALAGDGVVPGQVVDGAAHVLAGAIGRHALHQVRGLVHFGVSGHLAVV